MVGVGAAVEHLCRVQPPQAGGAALVDAQEGAVAVEVSVEQALRQPGGDPEDGQHVLREGAQAVERREDRSWQVPAVDALPAVLSGGEFGGGGAQHG